MGRCSSLTFCFYRLKPIQPKVKRQCAAGGLDKKRDKNLNGGAGVGRGKKDRASPEVRGVGIFCPVGRVDFYLSP